MIKAPQGYVPIPGSKFGGFHKLIGGHWHTWYPTENAGKERYVEEEDKTKPPRAEPHEEAPKQAAEPAEPPRTIKPDPALDKSIEAFHELNAKRDAAIEALHEQLKKPLERREIYKAAAEWYASPEGTKIVADLAGDHYDVVKHLRELKGGGAPMAAETKPIADNRKDLERLAERASAFAKDGPMIRGTDGALYTNDDFGIPGFDLARKEAITKTAVALVKRFADKKPGVKDTGPEWTPAEQEVLRSVALLTASSSVVAVHFPKLATPATGYDKVTGAERDEATLAQAILTTLATRRPPPIPLDMPFAYRGVKMPGVTIAGLHAGLTITLNSGASASATELVGGVDSGGQSDTYPVTYVFPKPATGFDISQLSPLHQEAEIVQAGTFAIEKIDHVGGYGDAQRDLDFGRETVDNRKRVMITLRSLTPQELSAVKVQHGGKALRECSKKQQVALWVADVIAHAEQIAERAEKKPADKPDKKVAKGGGWASRADQVAARQRAEVEVAKWGGSLGAVLKDPTSKLADPPTEDILKRTLAIWSNQGYTGTADDAKVQLNLRGGRYLRAIETMRSKMNENKVPAGFVPDGKNKGVWVKYSNGQAVQYWKAGKLFTPKEFEQHFMGEFDVTEKVKMSALADWSARIEKGGDGPQPPKGYTPIPGSKHGGYHKRDGSGWHTWYPPEKTAKDVAEDSDPNQGLHNALADRGEYPGTPADQHGRRATAAMYAGEEADKKAHPEAYGDGKSESTADKVLSARREAEEARIAYAKTDAGKAHARDEDREKMAFFERQDKRGGRSGKDDDEHRMKGSGSEADPIEKGCSMCGTRVEDTRCPGCGALYAAPLVDPGAPMKLDHSLDELTLQNVFTVNGGGLG